jgi:hypothetical protein
MTDKNARVTVKFLDSIAGQRDPTPEMLDQKYKKLAQSMEKQMEGGKSKIPKYSKQQIEAAVEAERKVDAGIIRTGFTKDFAFKVGAEALVSAAIAEAWEASGTVTIVKDKKAA